MIDNKTIVLTGASSGIGFEVLKLLAEGKGNRILAVARHVDNIKYFADNVTAFSCDISTQEGVTVSSKRQKNFLGKLICFTPMRASRITRNSTIPIGIVWTPCFGRTPFHPFIPMPNISST